MQSIQVKLGPNIGAFPAYSRPVRMDDFSPSNISMQVNVTGTIAYTIESSLDDPNDPTNPVPVGSMTWVPSSDTAVVGATTTQQTNFLFSPKYIRLAVASGSGSATLTILQSSNGPV